MSVFERGLESHPGVVELALLSGQDPEHVECVRAELRRHIGRRRERGLESLTPLDQIAVDLPEPAHPNRESQG